MEKHPQPHVIREQRHCGHLRRTSRPFSRSLRTNSRASSDTSGVQSGALATTNQSFKLLASSNNCPGQLRSSKSHQYRCHRAEWLVLQLTKLPKETEASMENSSITSQGCRIRLQPPSYARCVPNCRAQTCTFECPGHQKTPPKFNEKEKKKKTREDTQRERKKRSENGSGEEKKKRAKFWAVRRRWVRHRGSGGLAEGGPADTHTHAQNTQHTHTTHTHMKKRKLAKVEVSLS